MFFMMLLCRFLVPEATISATSAGAGMLFAVLVN